MKKLIVATLLLSPGLAQALPNDLPGSCRQALHDHYLSLPIETNVEVGFVTKDQANGRCHLENLGHGLKDAFPFPRERMDELFGDNHAQRIENYHTHPVANVAYFSQGVSYNGEIMFVNEAQVATRRLGASTYDKLVEAIRQRRIPGFSLNPPSIWDLTFAIHLAKYKATGTQNLVSRVITSGGIWTYSLADGSRARDVLDKLDTLTSYAMMYEAGHSLRASRATAARGLMLYERVMTDPNWAPLISRWASASLELRAPYSAKAVEAFLNSGNDRLIREEFAQKVKAAEMFSELLNGIGLSASFEPFG